MSPHVTIAGRYALLELIDQGGMGTVYRARDERTGQIVAVKALKPEITAQDPALIERFRREGKALRQLDHPNIIRVLETPESDGVHYIVMEYMTGGSLDKVLRRDKRLSVERTIQIALDVADALTRAHRLKIIHRDIKPANVLLAADGSLRLTDFGVAQMGDVRSKITDMHTFISTISYLSPEVIGGAAYDERSDIWGFGVMLYEMLTGRNPFAAASPIATLNAIRSDVPADIGETRPDVPADFVYLIDRMIAKDPRDRIASARTVGAELETILAQFNRAKLPPAIGTQEMSAANKPSPRFANATPAIPVPPVTIPPKPISPVDVPPAAVTNPVPQGRILLNETLGGDLPAKQRRVTDPRVFVAYRREDTGEVARKIYDHLHRQLGDHDVARDVDRVANRTINRVVLAQDIVQSFDAMVVIIGRQWMGVPGSGASGVGGSKQRALDNPKDSLRIQLEAGLKRPDMFIVPVLVDGATLPTADQLPPTLAALAGKQPFALAWKSGDSDATLEAQIEKLVHHIRGYFNAPQRRTIPALIGIGVALLALFGILALLSRIAPP